jgi:nucleoside-diphosphate-sugar epimerase
MTDRPTTVLVVGATGSIGRRVVAAAQRHELRVTALVRDPARAERTLPGVDLVRGDLQQPTTLAAAVQDVDAIVFTHGGTGSPDEARRIDYGGVANVLHALDGRTDHTSPGDDRLVFEQTDTGNGGIGREQVAEVLVRSLLTDTAVAKTFELFAEPGPAPTDWDGLFAPLTSDPAGALDGAGDPDTLPSLDGEPDIVRHDVIRLAGR